MDCRDCKNYDMCDKQNDLCLWPDDLCELWYEEGVEKTCNLLDNYHEELKLLLNNIPNNDYKIRLEGLINNYVR